MTLNEYQKNALTTDVLGSLSRESVLDAAYVAKILGLAGEAGEVVDKFKKIIRDKNSVVGEEDKREIVKELGDVLWYIAVLADYLGASLEEVAQANHTKLQSRKSRGVMQGEGDNR